ncbi:MAG TPA: hypothetical protein VII73_07425 [Caulobacteraceae bacterium]
MAVINPGLTPQQATPGLFQFDPLMLPKWRLQRSLVRAKGGTSRARVLCIGDSTTLGQGAGTSVGGYLIGLARDKAVPARMGALLAAAENLPCSMESMFGEGNVLNLGLSLSAYDSRITLGAGWAMSNTTVGGGSYQNSTTTNPITYTPEVNVDTFEVYFLEAPTTGVVTFDIDGSAPSSGPTTFNTVNASYGYAKVTIKAASTGAHTLHVKGPGTVGVIVGGIVAYDSTVGGVDIINAGWGASTTSNWAATSYPWSNVNALSVILPHLTIIELINDSWAIQNAALTTSNLQTLITEAKLSGDVLLCVPHAAQSGWDGGSLATQAAVAAAIKGLAASNNVPCIDWQARYGTWAAANTIGWMNDAAHCNAVMYEDKAALLARVLAA